ncbi:hypothetical protein SAMN04489711_1287 [Paracidovorax wautersii]|uniref:Uncharacterized protein n=1 Tax=Paracidovorax wautersii TaxID=1177982 RepID=A0A1I2HR74_9BURK|nr:hypothetical protein SAMN04489711_1287 [Paracidovorax wautersii]
MVVNVQRLPCADKNNQLKITTYLMSGCAVRGEATATRWLDE